MRLNASAMFAISLMVFGSEDDGSSRLLHIDVMPMLAPSACPIAVWIAEQYLVPAIPGGERLVHVCHQGLRRGELADLQAEAAAHNAAVAESALPTR